MSFTGEWGNSVNTFAIIWLVWLGLLAVVNIAFAYGIMIDASSMKRQKNRDTYVVPYWIWALSVLVGGVFVVGLYWTIHHSNLNPQNYLSKETENY